MLGATLAGHIAQRHLVSMFMVSEDDAAAIRTVFHAEGELSAAIELRRRFPGITDNGQARTCARNIAGWTSQPTPQAQRVTRRRSTPRA